MSSEGCDFFCFKDCGNKYQTHIMKKDIDSVEKLSLKKVNSNSIDHRKTLIKIKSVSKLQHPKCSTDRSNQSLQPDERSLLRKKIQIEKQIASVNESISMLNSKYKRKIEKLEHIKHQMGSLLKHH